MFFEMHNICFQILNIPNYIYHSQAKLIEDFKFS